MSFNREQTNESKWTQFCNQKCFLLRKCYFVFGGFSISISGALKSSVQLNSMIYWSNENVEMEDGAIAGHHEISII